MLTTHRRLKVPGWAQCPEPGMCAIEGGRVVVDVAVRQWREREVMLQELDEAESKALAACAPNWERLTAGWIAWYFDKVAEVQGTQERVRQAAKREFDVMVWGRELGRGWRDAR